eukprot:963545_1
MANSSQIKLYFQIIIFTTICLIFIAFIQYIYHYDKITTIYNLEEPQLVSQISSCNAWNNVPDITTTQHVIHATMPQTIKYLNKLYCHDITQQMEPYITHDPPHQTIHIAHVLNIYSTDIYDYSYLFVAAPVTFISMLNAKQEAIKHNISVRLYCSHYIEDTDVVPVFIHSLPVLTRSLQDTIWANNLTKPKKLPFVSDIIDSVHDHVDSEYIVYTNADIGLQPNFYVEVMRMMRDTQFENGVSITRKTIDYVSPDNGQMLTFLNLNEIYEMGLNGKGHAGHDCFVFKRDMWKRINMENVFLGYPTIGKTLMKQLLHLPRTAVVRDKYLTFHIGATRKMTDWFNKNGWIKGSDSERNDENHHEHSQLNRMFCDRILKRLRLK